MSLNKTIILREKVWVPIHKIDTDQVEQDFTKIFYDERACRTCDNRHEKHNHICDECPAFLGRYRTYGYKEKNGTQFIGIPMGQRHKIVSDYGVNLKKFEVVDLRKAPHFDYNIKFTGQLRDYQELANNTWFKAKYGLLIAPPRSGKTIMMLALGIRLGLRMVLLASQYEFLKQFIEHIEKFSNLPQLERKHGKKLYGYPKTESDFQTMQIMCCTYQQFISDKNGKKRLKWLCGNVGTVEVDECFTYNTLVLVDFNGRKEKIGDIVEGKVDVDSVVSFNHRLNLVEIKPLVSATIKETEELYEIEYENGKTLRCTGTHRFWCTNRNDYIKASELTEEDEILLFENS